MSPRLEATRGRPPAGPAGEHVAAMPKVRAPRATLERLQTCAKERGVPVWRAVELAVALWADRAS